VRPSPENGHAVCGKLSITGYERHIFLPGLCNEQTVKWVAMMKWKGEQLLILNPEEKTHAKDAMDTKEGTNEKYSTHHRGDTFSIQSFADLSGLARFAPLREIQLLFLG